MGLPSKEDREEILRNLTRKMPLAKDVDFCWLAEHSDQLSGAQLQFLCTQAGLGAIRTQNDVLSFVILSRVLKR